MKSMIGTTARFIWTKARAKCRHAQLGQVASNSTHSR